MGGEHGVLVTGGAGFIGRCLAAHLSHLRHPVVTLGRTGTDIEVDLLDAEATQAALRSMSFGRVVHLASPAKGYRGDDGAAREVAALQNVLLATGDVPLLYFTTADEFGDHAPVPQSETTPANPMTPYGKAKCAARRWLQDEADLGERAVTVFRPFSVYGPGQPPRMLVASLLSGIRAGTPVSISAQEKVRDFVHVEDIARAVLIWLENPTPAHRLFHLGTGVGTAITGLVALISGILHQAVDVRRDPHKGLNDPLALVADISRARATLGWRPQVTLEAGLRNLLEEHAR